MRDEYTAYENSPTGRETARAIGLRAFPSYKGRKFELRVSEAGMSFRDSHWSGGSKTDYAVVRLADNRLLPVPENGSGFTPAGDKLAGELGEQVPRPGFAVVAHSIFLGKDAGITLYLHPENLTKLVGQPEPAKLTADELTVVEYTAHLKSSYAGISNYRFHEANRDKGITLERWDAAKARLIARGLLNRAGAITDAGRDARAHHEIVETAVDISAAAIPAQIEGVTVSENSAKGGIELRFPSKPPVPTLTALKRHGFRWSRYNRCWYAIKTAERAQFAEALASVA